MLIPPHGHAPGDLGFLLMRSFALEERYRELEPITGCPRCGGALWCAGECLSCGWDGPTRDPSVIDVDSAERDVLVERDGRRRPRIAATAA